MGTNLFAKITPNTTSDGENLIPGEFGFCGDNDSTHIVYKDINSEIHTVGVAEITSSTNFIISPYNAVNKERADLVLTDNPTDNLTLILDALSVLYDAQPVEYSIPIRIDFLPGDIDLGTNQLIIPITYRNFHFYGNGVSIYGNIPENSLIRILADNIIFDGFNVSCGEDCVYGINNTGVSCQLTNNQAHASIYAIYNQGQSCLLENNYCTSYNDGLYNSGQYCKITNNKLTGDASGLNNSGNKCEIYGNTISGPSYGLTNSGGTCNISNNVCSGDSGALFNSGYDCVIIGNLLTTNGNDSLDNTGNRCVISGNKCSSINGSRNSGERCSIMGNIFQTATVAFNNTGIWCTISGNTFIGEGYGLFNLGGSCSISGNGCSSAESTALYNTADDCVISDNSCDGIFTGITTSGSGCVISGNKCSSMSDYDIDVTSIDSAYKNIIIGNSGINNGIAVNSGTHLPETIAMLLDTNRGSILIR